MPLCKLHCASMFIFAILVLFCAITALQLHHLDQMQIDRQEQLCLDKRIRKCGEVCHKVISDSSNKNLLSPQIIYKTKRDYDVWWCFSGHWQWKNHIILQNFSLILSLALWGINFSPEHQDRHNCIDFYKSI